MERKRKYYIVKLDHRQTAVDELGDRFTFAYTFLDTSIQELRSSYRGREIADKRAALVLWLLGDNPKRSDVPRVTGLIHRERSNYYKMKKDAYYEVELMVKKLEVRYAREHPTSV